MASGYLRLLEKYFLPSTSQHGEFSVSCSDGPITWHIAVLIWQPKGGKKAQQMMKANGLIVPHFRLRAVPLWSSSIERKARDYLPTKSEEKERLLAVYSHLNPLLGRIEDGAPLDCKAGVFCYTNDDTINVLQPSGRLKPPERGDSRMKGAGMLVGNFELNP